METNQSKHKIRICLGSSCYTRGNAENLKIIQSFVEENNLNVNLDFRGHLCHEDCNRGPVLSIDEVLYEEVQPFQVEKLLQEKLI
ncbi:(2Fe-2S) ferredoxin domain-containing protein [Labilibacter sediminis]|nr:(2Fe-2S) ferredoxin domain-containing protein [Labilibacter sediminis]